MSAYGKKRTMPTISGVVVYSHNKSLQPIIGLQQTELGISAPTRHLQPVRHQHKRLPDQSVLMGEQEIKGIRKDKLSILR